MDFVILKVNGKDVSSVAHEEMVQAFELAEEPIVIEVLRRGSAGNSVVATTVAAAAAGTAPRPAGPAGHRQIQQQQAQAQNQTATGWEQPNVSTVMSSVATQTDDVGDSMPAVRPVRPGLPSPPPLTAYEWPPPLRVTEDSRQCPDVDTDKVPAADDSDGAAVGLEEEDTEELLYLSITLRRQTISDRVGLTLCYGPADPHTGYTDVFIGEVDPDGIAGHNGILKEGDQVLQINGEDVHSRESAVRLFAASTKCISLLVCRSQLQWAEDDGFAEDHGEVFADSTYPATNDLRATATALDPKDCRQGNSCDFAVASTARLSDNGQDMPFDIGQYRELLGFDDCFGTEACLSTCGEEDEEEEEVDGAHVVHGREISEEHCRRFLQALQLKCDAMRVQPAAVAAAAAQAAAAMPTSATTCQQPPARPPKPRLGTVPLASATVAATSAVAAAGAAAAALQYSGCDKRPTRRPAAADDSSCHDTAYNTAESCRSGSIAAHDLPSQLLYGSSSSGGASPRLHADRCRATRSPPVHEEARARADGCAGKPGRCSSAAATASTAATAGAGQSAVAELPATAAVAAVTRSACDQGFIAYTDRHNLAQVMAMQQQRLLEERLAAAVTAATSRTDTEKQQRRRSGSSRPAAVSRSAAGGRPASPAAGSQGSAAATAASAGSPAGAASCGSGQPPLEWVVKVRSDGSRYIARRPAARTRLLKDRQRWLEAERCGLTTDDDAASELKLGRRWSHAERRRHLESAREHRRRKELMRLASAQRQRAAAASAGGDSATSAGCGEAGGARAAADLLLELSQRKQLRQQLADMDFTTVQELLVHGSRVGAAALAGKVLLSVTTV